MGVSDLSVNILYFQVDLEWSYWASVTEPLPHLDSGECWEFLKTIKYSSWWRETGYNQEAFLPKHSGKSPKEISEERNLKLHGLVFYFDFFLIINKYSLLWLILYPYIYIVFVLKKPSPSWKNYSPTKTWTQPLLELLVESMFSEVLKKRQWSPSSWETERRPGNGGAGILVCKRITCEFVKMAHSPEASSQRFWSSMAQVFESLMCIPVVRR